MSKVDCDGFGEDCLETEPSDSDPNFKNGSHELNVLADYTTGKRRGLMVEVEVEVKSGGMRGGID